MKPQRVRVFMEVDRQQPLPKGCVRVLWPKSSKWSGGEIITEAELNTLKSACALCGGPVIKAPGLYMRVPHGQTCEDCSSGLV